MEPPVFPWRIWCATAAIALVFFSFTLTTAVPVWLDESYIVEYGRVTLAGQPPVFGFHQRSDSQRPVYTYAVLGSILQEIAFRITSPSNAGPRVMALLGQIAAFGWFLYYLRLRGLRAEFSFLLALALLIDPLCDIGWRGGRVDGWAFAFLFASLCAIRKGRSGAFLGGMAASAGLLTWPSFAMFSPLILLEFWLAVEDRSGERRGFWMPMAFFAAGGALAAATIILPFRQEFLYGLADAKFLTALQSQMSRGDGFENQSQFLLLSFVQTPVVIAAGFWALAQKRNRWLLAGFIVALVFVFGTKVYRLRVLYLLPYFYLAAASLFTEDQLHWRRARAWIIGLMLFAGAGFTLAGTTLSGLSNRAGKDPLALIEPARSAVGDGPVRVYMQEPDFYFVGRTLGWEQFYCFDSCWGPGISTPTFQELLASMNVAIFRGEPDPVARGVIDKLGFRFVSVMLPDGGHQNTLFGWSYGPRSYGPYFIYRRP